MLSELPRQGSVSSRVDLVPQHWVWLLLTLRSFCQGVHDMFEHKVLYKWKFDLCLFVLLLELFVLGVWSWAPELAAALLGLHWEPLGNGQMASLSGNLSAIVLIEREISQQPHFRVEPMVLNESLWNTLGELSVATLLCWASLALLTLLKPICSQQHPKDGDSGSGRRGIGSPCFDHGQASSGAHWSTALSWESEGLTWIE